MSTISTTQLYSLLSEKVGKETAETLTGYIEDKIKSEFENKSDTLATKNDISNLEVKIAESRADMIKWMFIFWVGQVAATFGFILLFLKK
jgi:hypothetical protein